METSESATPVRTDTNATVYATPDKPSRWWAWVLLLVGLAVAGYFGYRYSDELGAYWPFGKTENVESEAPVVVLPIRPDTLATDSAAVSFGRDSIGDLSVNGRDEADSLALLRIASLNTLLDSTRQQNLGTPTRAGDKSTGVASDEGLFKVNTRYGKLASPTPVTGGVDAAGLAATPEGSASASADRARRLGTRDGGDATAPSGQRRGLFEELMLPAPAMAESGRKGGAKAPAEDFASLAREPSLDYAQLTEIVANLGSEILSDPAGQAAGAARVLDVIASGQGINAVLVADREGVIDYASDRHYLRRSVAALVSSDVVGLDRIRLVSGAQGRLVVIPLFHTYGRLGTAIVWLRPDGVVGLTQRASAPQ